MAEPTPAADGTPVPPEDTENGRAKHVAPTTDETVDRPAPARAATGPDAAPAVTPEPTVADRPAEPGAEPAPGRAAAAPAPEDVAPAGAGVVPARGDVAPAQGSDAPVRENVAPAQAEAATAAATAAAAAPAAGSDAEQTREERAVPTADRTAVLPESRGDRETGTEAASAGAGAGADDDRTAVLPADRETTSADRTPPPPAPEQRTAPLPPADAPPPPRPSNNRLVGTAWVLLAALIFEVVYLAAYALLIVVVYGTASVSPALASLNQLGLTWLPVILFALFYELAVLLLNRAGRFAYVLASLVVAVIVYLLTTFLVLAMQPGGLGNEGHFGQALIAPQIVLIPLVAREVMLWTGLAIGARGHRVRRRNRAAAEQYERERFARSVQDSDDRAGEPA